LLTKIIKLLTQFPPTNLKKPLASPVTLITRSLKSKLIAILSLTQLIIRFWSHRTKRIKLLFKQKFRLWHSGGSLPIALMRVGRRILRSHPDTLSQLLMRWTSISYGFKTIKTN